MPISINSGGNEILVTGTKAEFTALIDVISNFLDSLENSIKISLTKRNDHAYTFSFDVLELILEDHERLSFEIRNKQICIMGNREAMEMFRDNIIEPCSEFDFTDPRYHIDWFYYDGHALLNPTNLFITFSGIWTDGVI